jgi:hypothetical protein
VFEILIEITVGEYQHHETHLFHGPRRKAEEFAKDYVSTFWGDETNQDGEVYYDALGERAAHLVAVRELKTVTVQTPNGLQTMEVSFS